MRMHGTQIVGIKSKRGFTLVELLVVIGIIAVLVSLLLPAMSRARMQAQRTVCATQLRELAAAVNMYANENKGYVPEHHGYTKNFATTFPGSPGSMAAWGYAVSSTDVSGEQPIENPNFGRNGAGIGRLFVYKYLTDKRIVVCPATYTEGQQSPNNKERGPYWYNPHAAYVLEEAPAATKFTARYKKIRDFPRHRALLVEYFYNSEGMNHPDRKNKSAWFNLAYTDGHVSTVNNKYAYDRAFNAGHDATRNNEAIGLLEFAEAGMAMNKKLGVAWKEAEQDNAYYSFFPRVPN